MRMTKTYSQLMKQISKLQNEADDLKRQEVQGVIDRIKDAIRTYGLTAADLGLGPGRKAAGAVKAAKPARRKRAGKSGAKPKFRDEAGNTWVGRGKRPDWLRNALAAGKQLSDFEIR